MRSAAAIRCKETEQYRHQRVQTEKIPRQEKGRRYEMIQLPENFETYAEARKAGFLRMKQLKE